MCTAISFNSANNHYFGRSLDFERRFNESIVITPRNYIFNFNSQEIYENHNAMIGTATLIDNYPLYFDATNEHGLSMAGLNFIGNAYFYKNKIDGKINLAPYELIPYILSKCSNVDESIKELSKIVLIDIRFNNELSNAELHWIIADKKRCIVFEHMKNCSKIHENPVGVLTNNPPMEFQIMNLNNYVNISNNMPKNKFSDHLGLNIYSRGMGALGLPGDNSSMSRFVRCSFVKLNSIKPKDDIEATTQFFHILSSVNQVEGSVVIDDKLERTQYMSCCNTGKGIYYYKTYENSQISAINMHKENLEQSKLISYKMQFKQEIKYIN